MLNIVIAHYKENLDWIVPLRARLLAWGKATNVTVICKGDDAQEKPWTSIGADGYDLPNIGRESHSFLDFIVRTYEDIDPKGMYLFLQGNPFDHVQFIEIEHALYVSKPMLLYNWLVCDPNGWPHHIGLPINKVCERLGLEPQSHFVFAAGGQFLVTGEQIRSRPKSFYELALKVLFEGSENHVNPINGFVFERIWRIIFNLNP